MTPHTVWIGGPPNFTGYVFPVRKQEKEPELPPEPKVKTMSKERRDLLAAIRESGSLRSKEYAESSGRNNNTVNDMLRNLVSKEFVDKTKDPDHIPGNGVAAYLYFLTEKGKAALDEEVFS